MTAHMLSGTARLKVAERIGEGKLLKTLSVDSGEVTPVERGISLVEAGTPLTLVRGDVPETLSVN